MVLLHRAVRGLRALADVGRVIAAARAVEQARLAHELRLRALFWRLSCVGLMPAQQEQNRFLSYELNELADKFTAPPSANKMPKPEYADRETSHRSAQNRTTAGRIACPPAACGFRGSGGSAPGRAPEPAPRVDERPSDPGADHRVLQ